MVTSKRVAILLATATAIIWGLSFLSIKVAVTVVPPMSLGLARFVIATILFMLFFAAKRSLPRLALRDLPLMAGSGLIGVTLYFAGENNGIMLLSASESSIIVGTIPVLTVLADRLFTGQQAAYPAICRSHHFCVVGVSLMVVESLKISAQPLGYLYMGIAALAWVGYAFATRPMLAKYSQTEVTFWQGLFGALGFLPFALLESMDWAGLTPLIIMNVLYLAVFCSALGYLFYIISMDVLGAGVASVFINLIPVVSVVASFFILGERLSPLQLGGAAVAVAGVYLTTMKPRKPRPETVPT
jgi:drug/metabolite transporter (DMT)-like permease